MLAPLAACSDRIPSIKAPLGLPPVPFPAEDRPTGAKISLGEKLFFDRRLSANGTMSCAMCHVPEQAFTVNELTTAVGIGGASLRRNTPTVLNIAYHPQLFHDGRIAACSKPLLTVRRRVSPR
jgi:cytochrome c peroxidase